MKRKLFSIILVLVLGLVAFPNMNAAQAATKKSSFITNKKFVGTYGYEGQEGSFEEGWYHVTIYKITSSGKVRLQLDRGGTNASPLYATDILTAQIKGNKASFKYDEDGWENKGKGTIVFKKDGTLSVTVKETYTSDANRSTLAIPKTIFKKISEETE